MILLLLSSIKTPNNNYKLENFRLVSLTLCHLPLPGLRRNVNSFVQPLLGSYWSITDRHLSRALTRLVRSAVVHDLAAVR